MPMSRRHLSHLEDLLTNAEDAIRREIAENCADPVNSTTRKQAELLTLATMATLKLFIEANTDGFELSYQIEWSLHNVFFKAVMMERQFLGYTPAACYEWYDTKRNLIQAAKEAWSNE